MYITIVNGDNKHLVGGVNLVDVPYDSPRFAR